jgi:hypothetical protein
VKLPRINSHNSWSQLEEVWLGDVYPVEWYEHLEPEVRDVFQRITEITRTDLAQIQRTLENLNVIVQRPRYDRIDDFINTNGMLVKPEICPRDGFVVVDNRLFTPGPWISKPWNHILDQYREDSASTLVRNFSPSNQFNGANVVRTGRDILLDLYWHKETNWNYTDELPGYRVHQVDNGGHLDGCFAVLRPGLMIANNYFEDYDTYFPGWELIRLDSPSFFANKAKPHRPHSNGKFYDTTVGTNRAFNEHVIKHALDWVGMYTETYFELNCLVVNENTVVMMGENDNLFRELERRGITVHWVPMRTRPFWDSGVHCMTLDIRRQSKMEDYWPERELG